MKDLTPQEIAVAEYRYWRNTDENRLDSESAVMVQVGAMGAASNILASLNGRPAPWHQNQPGDGNSIFPAECRCWGRSWCGIVRVRVLFGMRMWKTYFHLTLWKFSIGMSFPAFLVRILGGE